VLCSHLGHNVFQAISSPNFVSIMHKSQTFGMVSHCFKCVWSERSLDCNVGGFLV